MYILGNVNIVFPAVSHFQNELLPQMRHGSNPAVAVVDDAHTHGQSRRNRIHWRRLELSKHLLFRYVTQEKLETSQKEFA